MARKLQFRDLGESPDARLAQLGRLVKGLQYPLSPEGKRVLAAAQVGFKLIRESQVTRRKTGKAKLSIAGDSVVVEERFPDSIREMLKQYRNLEQVHEHKTLELRPDRS